MTSNRVAAGTGIRGSASNKLNLPRGIFVDVNLDLYVADCGNHRVQLFYPGEPNGITVAGNDASNSTIKLQYPTGIILDAEKYLFILDYGTHQIVILDLNGFRCLVGRYGFGTQSNQLANPFSFSFDRSGNMFVTDSGNHRIQKFQYLQESCDNSSTVKSVYSLALTSNSPTYFPDCSRSNSYYEAIQMNVTITSTYNLIISSEMKNTHGYIYTNGFNLFDWLENRLIYNEDYHNQSQFYLTAILEANTKYVFVMTTSSPNVTGNALIQVWGRGFIGFNRILNTSSVVQTIYASELTTKSPVYFRRCSTASCYYEAIQVNVIRSGLYTFFSISDMDRYWYIYKEYFNPTNPDENRLKLDDKSCLQKGFRFTIALEHSITYILVMTAAFRNMIGAFSIFVSGPDIVDLKSISKYFHNIYLLYISQV
ncbi:unnamed protein product [Adineta steineri]|uniref:NHL repeat containing protein-like protein n=1 Tax=Adineta steineri TaxID=433720 RepID=A0A819T4Y8_9BILA|nr:unnamed protein product [Adineta steineri]